jgi:tetratricopeptide (TPR) repeat protein
MNSQRPSARASRSQKGPLERALSALRAEATPRHARLREAAAAMAAGDFLTARDRLTDFLALRPGDVHALNLLGESLMHLGREEEAETALRECLSLSPDLAVARYHLATVLLRLNRIPDSLAELSVLTQREPRNPLFRLQRAAALTAQGDHQAAAAASRALIQDCPDLPEAWIAYGRSLQVLGADQDCIAAYRTVIALHPSLGEAYWALANLKTFRFSADEMAAMEGQLRDASSGADRAFLHFALGKAYADEKVHAKAFDNYARGNALVRMTVSYDPDATTAYIGNCKALFTADFFAKRAGAGCAAADPIFIIGMPRVGSTLVAQILASHSAIENAGELKDITEIARHLERTVAPERGMQYPGVLTTLDNDALRDLGARYMESTRSARKLGRRFFVDKMPNNFPHLGLICLIFPNAKIVDVRRCAMACCFSNFTQHYADGQRYTYRLSDLGRVYRDYAALMAHFDQVLPGRIYRLRYEQLVAKPEAEARRLLDYLGLSFEPSCLRFHENRGPVATVSSEQVRTPIFRDGLDRWRDYEPWLGPLKTALGPALEGYSSTPG